MKFEELNLDERILRAVEDMGFEEASPIQASAIPVIMDDRDVVGQAQTGTGKDGSICYSCSQKIDPDLKKASGSRTLPDKRTCSPGCRRNQKACQVYERHKSASGIWWTGDCKTD